LEDRTEQYEIAAVNFANNQGAVSNAGRKKEDRKQLKGK
jgi:hypothetical protein